MKPPHETETERQPNPRCFDIHTRVNASEWLAIEQLFEGQPVNADSVRRFFLDCAQGKNPVPAMALTRIEAALLGELLTVREMLGAVLHKTHGYAEAQRVIASAEARARQAFAEFQGSETPVEEDFEDVGA